MFAQCTLKTPYYDEVYQFFGSPHSSSAQIEMNLSKGGNEPLKMSAQSRICGNQLEYQRINFLRQGVPIEIIFFRNGTGKEAGGTLYSQGAVKNILCRELYEYDCSCYAGHCSDGCDGEGDLR